MSRVFFFANRTCMGAVGGGRGVVYKLYLANKKYKMIEDAHYLFTDTDFDDFSETEIESIPRPSDNGGIKGFIKKTLRSERH